jgi:hypothetical protein
MHIAEAVVAFFIAFLIVFAEWTTSKYPATYVLLVRKSRALYYYSSAYGVIAFITMLLVDAGMLRLSGVDFANHWFNAIVVGLGIKAALHLRFYTVYGADNRDFPIGTETIVQMFEPALVKQIIQDEFDALRDFTEPIARQYPNLEDVKERILMRLPSGKLVEGVKIDLAKKETVVAAMELYIQECGVSSFKKVFPVRKQKPKAQRLRGIAVWVLISIFVGGIILLLVYRSHVGGSGGSSGRSGPEVDLTASLGRTVDYPGGLRITVTRIDSNNRAVDATVAQPNREPMRMVETPQGTTVTYPGYQDYFIKVKSVEEDKVTFSISSKSR